MVVRFDKQTLKPEATLPKSEVGHNDWVRDVAWAPSVGLPTSTIASCSQDKKVIIWTQEAEDDEWEAAELPEFDDVVWRVSWSVAGNTLAVSCGDNKVSMWKQSLDVLEDEKSQKASGWTMISQMNEGGEMEEVSNAGASSSSSSTTLVN
eukprot:TRINITY_DN80_c0_g1_i8.p2 TRINITY_DN80_c0_g1~~TRINITY_DN80_c0_g1_i8.p2  ORF type:complete len:150 (-),score=64.40 TRINITY_DN80_c0_g1_i8:63-512(-)